MLLCEGDISVTTNVGHLSDYEVPPVLLHRERSGMVHFLYVRIGLQLAATDEAPGCAVRIAILVAKNTDFRSCVEQEVASRHLVSYEKQALCVAGRHGPYSRPACSFPGRLHGCWHLRAFALNIQWQ